MIAALEPELLRAAARRTVFSDSEIFEDAQPAGRPVSQAGNEGILRRLETLLDCFRETFHRSDRRRHHPVPPK